MSSVRGWFHRFAHLQTPSGTKARNKSRRQLSFRIRGKPIEQAHEGWPSGWPSQGARHVHGLGADF